MRNNLDVRSITVERSNRSIIRELSLGVANGSLIHLKGENGSGKTTLLRTIAGLIPPAEGEIFWNSSNIIHQEIFHPMLNFVSENCGLANELTTFENLSFLQALSKKTKHNTVEDALQKMNLSQTSNSYLSVLSAGQRQRVSLTQLLLFECPLWLLDEPFNSLDADTCKTVEGLIDAHVIKGGIAIVASHQSFQLATAQKTIELL